MLMIRLARKGKPKQPTYRLIVSEKTKDTHGTFLEELGNYNPRTNPKTINLKVERIQYWLAKGAQSSPTIHNLLVDQKVIDAKKVKASKKGKPNAKAATEAPKETAAPTETPVDKKEEN